MTGRDLVEHLEKQAGEYHRATVRYDSDDITVLHIRNDMRESLLTSRIDRMLRRIRPESSSSEERAFPFGELNATVRLFQDAIFIHFPLGNNHGIAVTLEPETARNLNTFIGECEKRIQQ
jgi:arginine repressor